MAVYVHVYANEEKEHQSKTKKPEDVSALFPLFENGRGGLNEFFHLFLANPISIKTNQCESFCILDFQFQSPLWAER